MATRPHISPDGIDIVVTISRITPALIDELAWFLNGHGFSVEINLPDNQSLRPHAYRVGHVSITRAKKPLPP
jgi:hypothetical protein